MFNIKMFNNDSTINMKSNRGLFIESQKIPFKNFKDIGRL